MVKKTEKPIYPPYPTTELLKHWISELTDYSPQQIESILERIEQKEAIKSQ